jgi:hypothetical protein
VPDGIAVARVHDEAGRLVDHDQVFVFEHDVSAMSSAALSRPGRRSTGRAFGELDALAAIDLALGLGRTRRRPDQPCLSQPCRRLRECSGNSRASVASSRQPAHSAGTSRAADGLGHRL